MSRGVPGRELIQRALPGPLLRREQSPVGEPSQQRFAACEASDRRGQLFAAGRDEAARAAILNQLIMACLTFRLRAERHPAVSDQLTFAALLGGGAMSASVSQISSRCLHSVA